MVTAEGRVKVLDFGVAKLRDLEIAAAGDDLTRSPTRQLTGEGKIIGTVAYMSPEQAEGKPVDPRSDIFAVGVLLHEMATGDRPFKGDTNVSIISSILKDNPAPVTDLNPRLPADLARIIRRCLAKDPGRRYQTAADLRNELEDLKQDVDSGVSAITTRPVARPRPSARWLALAAIALALIAAATWYVVNGKTRVEGPGDVRDRSLRPSDDNGHRLAGGHIAGRKIRRPREGEPGRSEPLGATDRDDQRRADRGAGARDLRRRRVLTRRKLRVLQHLSPPRRWTGHALSRAGAGRHAIDRARRRGQRDRVFPRREIVRVYARRAEQRHDGSSYRQRRRHGCPGVGDAPASGAVSARQSRMVA